MPPRVIAGRARGVKLKSVPGDRTRPIMDRVKEALFSIIGENIIDSYFLDLFAGTGGVGIEALSRGAKQVLFIEKDRSAIVTIRDNLKRTRLDAGAVVRQRDALDVLARPPDMAYDFIFVAPPQYRGMWRQTLESLDKNETWHNGETVVIVQIDPREENGETPLRNLREYDRRKYGSTLLLFYVFECHMLANGGS